jgi:hypothetical protein
MILPPLPRHTPTDSRHREQREDRRADEAVRERAAKAEREGGNETNETDERSEELFDLRLRSSHSHVPERARERGLEPTESSEIGEKSHFVFEFLHPLGHLLELLFLLLR